MASAAAGRGRGKGPGQPDGDDDLLLEFDCQQLLPLAQLVPPPPPPPGRQARTGGVAGLVGHDGHEGHDGFDGLGRQHPAAGRSDSVRVRAGPSLAYAFLAWKCIHGVGAGGMCRWGQGVWVVGAG